VDRRESKAASNRRLESDLLLHLFNTETPAPTRRSSS
jgi:hypothetical protein